MLDLTPVGPGQTVDDALYERDQARIAELEAALMELTFAAAEVVSGRNLAELGETRLLGAINDAEAVLAQLDRREG